MSWHYLQGQEVVSSEDISWDGTAFAPSKSRTILGGYCLPGSGTGYFPASPYGMTSAHSTAGRGGVGSMSSAEDSHARTSVQPGREKESPAPAPVYGLRWPGLSLKFDRDTASWRIAPSLFPGDSIRSSVTLPRWGMMRSGELSELTIPEHLTSETGYGYWPTPTGMEMATEESGELYETGNGTIRRKNEDGSTSNMGLTHTVRARGGQRTRRTYVTPRVSGEEHYETVKSRKGIQEAAKHNTLASVEYQHELTPGALNPDWVEWLMGWPMCWTSLEPMCQRNGVQISRVAVGVSHRVDRLKAIGNGQVPAVARLAWQVLTHLDSGDGDE